MKSYAIEFQDKLKGIGNIIMNIWVLSFSKPLCVTKAKAAYIKHMIRFS